MNGPGCRSDYCRIPQDTACYPWMLQDTFIDMFNRVVWYINFKIIKKQIFNCFGLLIGSRHAAPGLTLCCSEMSLFCKFDKILFADNENQGRKRYLMKM